jgi:hypothetical protein
MAEKNITSVFLAGADDCDDLRAVALEVFQTLNTGKTHEFLAFDWREDTDCDNFPDFQDAIFQSAEDKWGKPECDILVLLLWTKFGKHTIAEYNRYIAKFDTNTRLMACHYNGEVKPLDLDKCNVQGLFSWKRKVAKNWSEISPVRGSIENLKDFRNAFTTQMSKYKDRIIENSEL